MRWNEIRGHFPGQGCGVKLRLEGRLPRLAVTLRFTGQQLHLDRVLLDTGDAGSVFAADAIGVESGKGAASGSKDSSQQ